MFSSLLLLSFETVSLHFVKSHGLDTCDSPSPTVLMTSSSDLFYIGQESLFGRQEICTAMCFDRQVVSCCFMWFTANLLMTCLLCKQLAGDANKSTHIHTASYATDNNSEVLSLCTNLRLTANLSLSIELNALPWNGVSNK